MASEGWCCSLQDGCDCPDDPKEAFDQAFGLQKQFIMPNGGGVWHILV